MSKELVFSDREIVSCEACAKAVPRSAALQAESRDGVAYFCGMNCYDSWSRARAPEREPHEVQAGQGHRKSRDERMKRLVQQHPLRDEPRIDSVEPDEIPPP
jgi:hypothetical protein